MNITLKDGRTATLLDETTDEQHALIRVEDGRTLRVDRSLIQERADGYYLDLSFNDLAERDVADTSRLSGTVARQETIVPVIGEELHVDTGVREIGSVRVHKTVQVHNEVVDQPVVKERVDVKRVVMNQVVNEMMPVRQMGDTMIIPLVEEVLKVEKQLVLREEIHVTRTRTEERVQQTVPVRREEATVERLDEHGSAVPVDTTPERVPSPRVESPRSTRFRPASTAPPRKNKLIK